MKKLLIPILLLLLALWIWFGLNFCKKCFAANSATPAKTTAVVPEPTTKEVTGWQITDGSFSYDAPQALRFNQSEFNLLAGDKDINDVTLGKVADYLKSHGDRALTVTGLYTDTENNGSIFPSLGLARANDVKKQLMNFGVPSIQLLTADKLVKDLKFDSDILSRGINFGWGAAAKADDRLADIKARLIGKPITLYFQTNASSLDLSAQQRKDFADIIYYLDNVGTSGISVSGHTDSMGDHAYNVQLSQERAQFVKAYLQKNGGINVNRMTAAGFGPDRPIGDNDSAEGRAKNRRVEVTLK